MPSSLDVNCCLVSLLPLSARKVLKTDLKGLSSLILEIKPIFISESIRFAPFLKASAALFIDSV